MTGASLKANARKLMYDNAPRLFFISALYVMLIAILSFLSYRLPGTIDLPNMYERLSSGETLSITMIYRDFRPLGALLSFLIYFFNPILGVGFISYCLKTIRKKETEYKDIFSGFEHFFKVLGIFVMTTIYIFLWSLLLVVPGIVAAYKYRLSYYILLDDPSKGVFQCIGESSLMMHGSKLDLFIIDLSFLGWHISNFIVILLLPLTFIPPVILIWLEPYRGMTLAGFYEHRKSLLAV